MAIKHFNFLAGQGHNMNKILEGTLRSSNPERLKRNLVRRVIDAARQPQTTRVVADMFHTTMEIILKSESDYEVAACQEVYHAWARYNR